MVVDNASARYGLDPAGIRAAVTAFLAGQFPGGSLPGGEANTRRMFS